MKNKMGRPFSVMSSANKDLQYMIDLYSKYDHLDDILKALDVSYLTFYRWNNNISTPHSTKHLMNLEKETGFTAEEIKLQHMKLNLKRA